jgi:MFS family permease
MAAFRGMLIDVAPLRASPDFVRLCVSQLFSVWCRQIVVVALPYQVYVSTHSSFAVGLLGMTQALASVAIGLYGGGLVDRFDRRRVQAIGKTVAATSSLALVLGAVTNGVPVWALYGLSAIGSAAYALDQSARSATVPRLVGRQLLPSALSLNQVLQNGGAIIGPAIGGLVIAEFGLVWAYSIDVLGFLPAVILIGSLTAQPPVGGNVTKGWRAPIEALVFVRRSPILMSTFAADLTATIFGMPTAVFPALALNVFKIGPAGLGLLYAAPAVGALIGALFSGWVVRIERQGAFIVGAIAVWGLAITGFGLLGQVRVLGLVMLAIAGAGDMVSAIFRQTILQLSVPDSLRGRMSAFNLMVVTTGPRLGDLEAGSVAALFSPIVSVVSGGLLSVFGIAVLAAVSPTLRSYRRPHDDTVAEAPATIEPPSDFVPQ